MTYPRVSIIVTTYNSERFLKRAIDSILNQTFQDFEVIIVDDASTDRTREIIKNYEIKDSRIKSIFLKENSRGPAKPLNEGIKVAKGKYIAFLEHDDEWLPKKLEKQIEIFEKSKNEKLKWVGCFAFIVDERKKKIRIQKFPDPKNKKLFLSKLRVGDFLTNWSAHMIESGAIEKIGYVDENLKSLWNQDFWIRRGKRI